MSINCIFKKKNVDKTQRNGLTPESKTIIKYVTQTGTNGINGDDAFNVYITPQAKIFNAGPVSQSDTISVYAFRGTSQLGTWVDSSAFTNLPTGLDCSISNNGTVLTTVTVTASNTLEDDGGTIVIPVKYATDTYDASTVYDASLWDASLHTFADVSTYYSWTLVKPTASNWNLDLTNENASINADASGNIYATAVRPTCTAKLTRGTEDVATAVYYISTPNVQNVQGLSINSSSGVLTFNDGSANTPFSFSGTSVEITVTAKVNNELKGTKIMTVSKSLAGKDGDGSPAVSYWLDFSADAIKVNKAGTPSPSSITATAYKQLGGDNPQTATECWMKWGYNTTDPSTATSSYTYTLNSIDASKDYITFKLYKDTSTYLGESETIPILKDGLDGSAGSPGSAGPAGPVIRGPILWTPDLRRRFCAGSGNMATDSSYIDIVYYDPSGGVDYHYYRCTDSYTQSNALHTWSQVSGYWTQAEGEYDFIATQLLLANNAKIKFLTNNEFYLTDASGNIHGGGRAATSDSSVIFWAGSAEGSTNINAAPFQVDIDGNIRATSGTFAGYVQMPYKFIGALQKDLEDYYIADASAYLIADEYLTGVYYDNDAYSQGPILKLPEPSSTLNGFTYHILVWPNIATRASDQNPVLSIVTANGNAKFLIPAFACDTALTVSPRKKIAFYAGHVEITCIPRRENYSTDPDDWTYYWMITMCTGGIEVYNNSDLRTVTDAYGPIYGYSPTANYYVPVKIQTENNPATNRKRDTIYITLP